MSSTALPPTITSAAQRAGVEPRRRGGLARLTADTLAVAGRNLLELRRDPTLLVFTLLQPVLFVLLFRYAFGGAITTDGAYVDFLMPGIFVQTVTWGAITTGVGLAEDRRTGLTERMRALPMSRLGPLAGRTVSDLVRNAAVVAVLVLMGLAVGFRPEATGGEAVTALVLLLGWSFAVSWAAAVVGLLAGTPEAAQAVMTPLLFPLTFASSAFVPTDTMPSWLATFAEAQPFTVVVDAVRGLVVAGAPAGDPALALLWSAVVVVVAVPLSVRAFTRQ